MLWVVHWKETISQQIYGSICYHPAQKPQQEVEIDTRFGFYFKSLNNFSYKRQPREHEGKKWELPQAYLRRAFGHTLSGVHN